MSTSTRIYRVTNSRTSEVVLVEAANAPQARNHVAAKLLTAAIASPKEIAELFTTGGASRVEVAGEGEATAG